MAFPQMTTWFLSNVFGISDVPFVSDCKEYSLVVGFD